MDKIARLRQEIERRMKIYKESNYGISLRYQELEELLSFLDTLSEEPDKSLEEAAENYIAPIENDEGLDYINFNGRDIKDAFIAGAEWQASQMPMPEDTVLFNKGVAEGRRLEREDMMKDSVTVECYVRVYPTLDDKPRPWVALYKNGIGCNSLRDIPELENIGFKDNDTAIVIIKRKEDGQ